MKACSALAELGHDVRLWTLGSDPELPWEDIAKHYGVKNRFAVKWIADFPWPRGWLYSLRAVRAARRWRADLYYVWPYQAAALASRKGLPTLLELHDRPHGRMGPILFRRFLTGGGARRVVITTKALLDWVKESYAQLLDPPSTIVAPNGVDLERYHNLPTAEEARILLDLPDRPTAGYTGHLYRGRGLDLMVELAQRYPEVNFLWAGGEKTAVERWRARLEELGLENVSLLGFLSNEEMPMVQASCDVLLMPYERQIEVSSGGDTAAFASPMKVFEYLAAGRAILASDLPVIREILNESNSMLLPADDVAAWGEALGTLMADPGQRNWLAAHALEDAPQYSWIARAASALEGLEE
ncbi:MAG: glycosyltransferase family 4 protein [Anaerolineales bacterium]